MRTFLTDLRYAGRMLLKHPSLTGTAVMALAMGIGFTTIMFSIVHGALIRGLPYDGADRIIHLERTNPSEDIESMGVSIHDYVDWRAQQSSFEHLGAYYTGTINLRGTERPVRYGGAFITANSFPLLGVQATLGRTFREDEDEPGAPLTAILSHHVWQDLFDGDPNILGQVVNLNGEAGEIIGVMPEGFMFPIQEDLWVPLRMNPLEIERNRGTWLEVFGKLRVGTSVDQAMTEFTGISQRLGEAYPETNAGVLPLMQPFTREYIGDEAVPLLLAMLATVSLVLVIACINVANLLLARAALRVKEMGIRTALGAHRWRIMSQMISESMALALVGAVLGTGIAWVGISAFSRAVADTDPPYWLAFELDVNVLLFILAITILAAIVSGLIPAVKATGTDITSVLKDDSRGASSMTIGRTSRLLVIGELAMSLGLLVAAGLMTKSIVTLRNFDYGFETESVFTARVGLFENEFPDTLSRLQFFEQVQQRVRDLPGVRAAALSAGLPGLWTGGTRFAIEGAAYATDQDYPEARRDVVTGGFFETFGVEIQRGRDFNDSDNRESLPVAIVNQSFADKHFPQGVLGGRIQFGDSDRRGEWLTIVGVVPDLFMEGVGNPDSDPAGLYTPLAQGDARFLSIVARGPSNPMTLTPAVRDAVAAVHADTPLYFVESMADRMAQSVWFYNVFGILFLVFGAAALLMAAIGLYGVMAFNVSTRTTEMGIRMAIGAHGPEVLKMIMKQGMIQIAVGLGLGLVVAVLVARGLGLVLFQVEPYDPAVFLVIMVVLATTGLLASFVPARRATRVDPMVALRRD